MNIQTGRLAQAWPVLTSPLPPTPTQPVIKPQYVDHIPKAVRGNVLDTLKARDQKGLLSKLLLDLELEQVRGVAVCGRRLGGGRRGRGRKGQGE